MAKGRSIKLNKKFFPLNLNLVIDQAAHRPNIVFIVTATIVAIRVSLRADKVSGFSIAIP